MPSKSPLQPITSEHMDTLLAGRRMRRNRRTDWSRRLVRENTLTVDDLIWPIFLVDGDKVRQPVPSMPGVFRLSVDEAVREAERAASFSIPAMALFPYTNPELRDETGSEALNPENLTCRALRAIKAEGLNVGLMTDVALDPYTSHGHDGLMDGETILNDETIDQLCRQSLVQAEAGSDVIAPSDMMDGRIGAIRESLDGQGFRDTQIMAYSAKYASAFYGPVPRRGRLLRDAQGRQADLPDGPGQHRRGAARDRTRHRRGRRHGDGQARHALSRHRPAPQG
jgi:porphobilinogen synthase